MRGDERARKRRVTRSFFFINNSNDTNQMKYYSLFNTLKILFNTCRPALRGNCTPYQKITYLKVVNHFFFAK